MSEDRILDLREMVVGGGLFRSPEDGNRVEAFIPPLGIQNHAANMAELPNGDLLCVWFSGTFEGGGDVRIGMSRLPAGGAQWTEPVWVSTDTTRSEQNPVLFVDPEGKVWVLYTSQGIRDCTPEEWQAMKKEGKVDEDYTMQWTAIVRCRVSEDNGHTWGPVQTFAPNPGSFARQPMLVMSNGDWLFPIYYSTRTYRKGGDYTVMRISEDKGETWREYEVPESRGRVQAAVVELEAGYLAGFMRSRSSDRIYVTRSSDYGRTWTPAERTVLPNNNASIQTIKLASGNLAMIYNHYSANDDPNITLWPIPRHRYPTRVAISEDGGYTWPYMRDIDSSDDFAGEANKSLNRRCDYPCIIQTRDGALHAAYSYRDRQCIKYVRFSEEWVRGQLDYVVED